MFSAYRISQGQAHADIKYNKLYNSTNLQIALLDNKIFPITLKTIQEYKQKKSIIPEIMRKRPSTIESSYCNPYNFTQEKK
jgi:hypothetical protein